MLRRCSICRCSGEARKTGVIVGQSCLASSLRAADASGNPNTEIRPLGNSSRRSSLRSSSIIALLSKSKRPTTPAIDTTTLGRGGVGHDCTAARRPSTESEKGRRRSGLTPLAVRGGTSNATDRSDPPNLRVPRAASLPLEQGNKQQDLMPLALKLYRNVLAKRIPWQVIFDDDAKMVGSAGRRAADGASLRRPRLLRALQGLPALACCQALDAMLQSHCRGDVVADDARSTSPQHMGGAPPSPLLRLIVHGCTGCGKSVLMPLKLLDHHWHRLQCALEETFPNLVVVADDVVGGAKDARSGTRVPAGGSNSGDLRPVMPPKTFDTSSKQAFVRDFARQSRVRIVVSQPTRMACVNLAYYLQALLNALNDARGDDSNSSVRATMSTSGGVEGNGADIANVSFRCDLRRVGYAVANDVHVTPGAEILFATPQYLLNRLQLKQQGPQRAAAPVEDRAERSRGSETGSATAAGVLHQSGAVGDGAAPLSPFEHPTDMILDEVHRRDVYTDLLLLWCRRKIDSQTAAAAVAQQLHRPGGLANNEHLDMKDEGSTAVVPPPSPSPTAALEMQQEPGGGGFCNDMLRSVVLMSATADNERLRTYLAIPPGNTVCLSPAAAEATHDKRTVIQGTTLLGGDTQRRSDMPPTRGVAAELSLVASHHYQRHVYPVDVVFADELHACTLRWRPLFAVVDDDAHAPPPREGPHSPRRGLVRSAVAINDSMDGPHASDCEEQHSTGCGLRGTEPTTGANRKAAAPPPLTPTRPPRPSMPSATTLLWMEAVRMSLDRQTFLTIEHALRRLTRRAERRGGGLVATSTDDGGAAAPFAAEQLSLGVAECVASLAAALAMCPVVPLQQDDDGARSPPTHNDTRTPPSTTDDLDEEDRVLVFAPGLSEMLLLFSALHRVAGASRRDGASAIDRRQLLSDDEDDARAMSHELDAVGNPLSTTTAQQPNVSIPFGQCRIQVTLLHSTAVGETSRQLEGLPHTANRGRNVAAIAWAGSASFGYDKSPRAGGGGGGVSDGRHDTMPRPYRREVGGGPGAATSARVRQCRIIIATNVAESSITIPGLRAVVDMATERVVAADPETGGVAVSTTVVSQSSLLQRRGRVGRTGAGVAIHLMPRHASYMLPIHDAPEALRGPPSKLVMLAKLYFQSAAPLCGGHGTVVQMPSTEDVLAALPSPPQLLHAVHGTEELITHRLLFLPAASRQDIREAQPLHDLSTCNAQSGGGSVHQVPLQHALPPPPPAASSWRAVPGLEAAYQMLRHGSLTRRGRFIAAFPMELRWTTLLYYGGVFGVLPEALLMACVLSVPTLVLPLQRLLLDDRLSSSADRTRSNAYRGDDDAPSARILQALCKQHAALRAFATSDNSGGVVNDHHQEGPHDGNESGSRDCGSISEPMALLAILQRRYQLHDTKALGAFESGLSLNRNALVTVDHSVAMCVQRIMDLWRVSQLPTEWAHVCRSHDTRVALGRLRAAALDRLSSAQRSNSSLATWSPSPRSALEVAVVRRRLMSAFVAAFSQSGMLRAEDTIFPSRLRKRLSWNHSALSRSNEDDDNVAAGTATAPSGSAHSTAAETDPLTRDACLVPLLPETRQWLRGREAAGAPSSPSPAAEVAARVAKDFLHCAAWPLDARPRVVDILPGSQHVCMSFPRAGSANETSPPSGATAITFAPLGMSVLHTAISSGAGVLPPVRVAMSPAPCITTASLPANTDRGASSGDIVPRSSTTSGTAPWATHAVGQTARASTVLGTGRDAIVLERDTVAVGSNIGPVARVVIPRDGHSGMYHHRPQHVLDVARLVELGWQPLLPAEFLELGVSPNAANAPPCSLEPSEASLGPPSIQEEITARDINGTEDDDDDNHGAAMQDATVAVGVGGHLVAAGIVRWVAVVAQHHGNHRSDSAPHDDGGAHCASMVEGTAHVGAPTPRAHPQRTMACPVCQTPPLPPGAWALHTQSTGHLRELALLVGHMSNYTLTYDAFMGAVAPWRVGHRIGHSAAPVLADTQLVDPYDSVFSVRPCRVPSTSIMSLLQVGREDAYDTAPCAVPPVVVPAPTIGDGGSVVGQAPDPSPAAVVQPTPTRPLHRRKHLHGSASCLGIAASLVSQSTQRSRTDAASGGGTLTAHGLWLMSMAAEPLPILKGLVVAASHRNTVSILTDGGHSHVYAIAVGNCGVFGLTTPLDASELAYLEALYACGSEHGASKALRRGQSRAATTEDATPVPNCGESTGGGTGGATGGVATTAAHGQPHKQAPVGPHQSGGGLHWCTLSATCPGGTFVAASSSAVDMDDEDVGASKHCLYQRRHRQHLPSVISDRCVGAMILLALQRLVEQSVRRVTLGKFQLQLLELLEACHAQQQLAGVSASDALRFFLTKRRERLQDVLQSLGCVFHLDGTSMGAVLRGGPNGPAEDEQVAGEDEEPKAGDGDEGNLNSDALPSHDAAAALRIVPSEMVDREPHRGRAAAAAAAGRIRFYPPPIVASVLPSPQLREMLRGMRTAHHPRGGGGDGYCPEF